MRAALREHWPEYLMEACHLRVFFILSACAFATFLYYLRSSIGQSLESPMLR